MLDNEYVKKLFSKSDWSPETLELADEVCREINKDLFNLDIYPNQYEVVTAEQMLDAYSLIGLPISYGHWKFGKDFAMNESRYKRGQMGLSYEMVINSNPCISYNMEENTTCLMVLVIAHAGYGHNTFFKNNYMFKQWTQADSIIDYMQFARKFISDCEEKYGYMEVESILDACHALMNYGISKYKKPYTMDTDVEVERIEKERSLLSDIWRTLPPVDSKKKKKKKKRFPTDPEENILYFIEKNSPMLKDWQREVVRIVRKTAQYFYPQAQTKVINEGVATFTHFHMVNEMYDRGFVNDGFMLEFLKHHSNVIYQPSFDSKFYSGFNPYTLGFNIISDVKRICEEPTDEDKEWFPELIGKDFKEEFKNIIENYKDDSFIMQYLSPKVMREMRMFTIEDKQSDDKFYTVGSIHNNKGYKKIREDLSNYYNRSRYVPDIQVYDVDLYGDRSLTLLYTSYDKRELNEKTLKDVMDYVEALWGFDVRIKVVDGEGEEIEVIDLKEKSKKKK
ncbi:MAG: putative hydrolase [uncultured marine phage]|uniref:Putative hydrolase n=1 Tax=uncultured marine phage TaxID=707152 RepID=A0A8D9FRZ9_9VIRU|nr:MAG: putative hydrolase [uncultured marine phage]